jgi:hypothetical protein
MKKFLLRFAALLSLMVLSACGHANTEIKMADTFDSYKSELRGYEKKFETIPYVSSQDKVDFEKQQSETSDAIQAKKEKQTQSQLSDINLKLETLRERSTQISTALGNINALLTNPYLDTANRQTLETLYAEGDHFESFDAFSKELETAYDVANKAATSKAQAAKDTALSEAKPWLDHESMPHRDKDRLASEIQAVEQASVEYPIDLQAAISKLQEVLNETSAEATRIQQVNEANRAKGAAASAAKAKLPKLTLEQVQSVANNAVNDTAKNADSALWSLQQNTSSDILIYWITVDGDEVYDPSVVDTDYVVREVYSVEDLGSGKFRVEFIIDTY